VFDDSIDVVLNDITTTLKSETVAVQRIPPACCQNHSMVPEASSRCPLPPLKLLSTTKTEETSVCVRACGDVIQAFFPCRVGRLQSSALGTRCSVYSDGIRGKRLERAH
jgi:hypothetical protein